MNATAQLTSAASAHELGDVLRDYLEVAGRLQQTHETLQREVVRLRQELASKDQELERRRRLAALGELAAGVAHEVRNPLGAIQLYSDLLRKECGSPDAEPALKLLERIDAGIRAIDGVVRDTLALAPRGRALSAHNVREIIERATDTALSHLQRCEIELEARIEDGEATVLADAPGLTRVLVNLFTNAADASTKGGRISVTARATDDGFVSITVADRGPGIADEVIERVFDPFFTTKENGTGLGLSIAHRLIEAFGGRLTARNRPDGGTEFVMHLRDGRTAVDDGSAETSSRQITAA